MGEFIYFTEEQKERANAVSIADILQKEHEEVERSGNEWRWKRHNSVTFRGNSWYRHSQQAGSHAIDFMQEFFGMTYPEAVTYLLNGETGQVIHGGSQKIPVRAAYSNGKQQRTNQKVQIEGTDAATLQADKNTSHQGMTQEMEEAVKEKLPVPPQKNDAMKRVYAYLMQKRHISREILSFFARQGTLYECAEHHNAIFVGKDREGNIRHIHKKGTCSDGSGFRMNEEGSDSAYGFGYAGKGNRLYVFEAPIDLLSFLTLYPKNWQENSYITLNGVAEHAMLQMLKDYSNLDTVVLCLDHDAAGIEAAGRLAEILVRNDYKKIQMLQPAYKDWNEDLKNLNGEEALPAQEHPKMIECDAWISVLKQVTESMNMKYATKEYLCHYYHGIYNALRKGRTKENLEEAFDESGMLLAGVLVKCMEKEGRALGKETGALQILDNLQKRYRPHQDKGNFNNRVRKMQNAFAETMEVLDTKDLNQKENKELFVKKCMSLTMECIRAHIFVAVDYQGPVSEQSCKAQTIMGDIHKQENQLQANGRVRNNRPEEQPQTGGNQTERREELQTSGSDEKQKLKTEAADVKTKLQEESRMDAGDKILTYESQTTGEPEQKEGGMFLCSQ